MTGSFDKRGCRIQGTRQGQAPVLSVALTQKQSRAGQGLPSGVTRGRGDLLQSAGAAVRGHSESEAPSSIAFDVSDYISEKR